MYILRHVTYHRHIRMPKSWFTCKRNNLSSRMAFCIYSDTKSLLAEKKVMEDTFHGLHWHVFIIYISWQGNVLHNLFSEIQYSLFTINSYLQNACKMIMSLWYYSARMFEFNVYHQLDWQNFIYVPTHGPKSSWCCIFPAAGNKWHLINGETNWFHPSCPNSFFQTQ